MQSGRCSRTICSEMSPSVALAINTSSAPSMYSPDHAHACRIVVDDEHNCAPAGCISLQVFQQVIEHCLALNRLGNEPQGTTT